MKFIRKVLIFLRFKLWFVSFHIKRFFLKKSVNRPIIYLFVYGLVLAVCFTIIYQVYRHPRYFFKGTLHYFDNNNNTFQAEKRTFKTSPKESENARIKKVIDAFLLDPLNIHLRRNQQIFIDCTQANVFSDLLVLNFNKNFLKINAREEQPFMKALAKTLADCFPKIERFRILVAGEMILTLGGFYEYDKDFYVEKIALE